MGNELNKENKEETKFELTEEQITEREALLEAALECINSYGLKWTFKSINFIVKQNKVTFNQLRNCVFKRENEAYYDLDKALMLIIEAGLVGSNQVELTKVVELENRTYEILENWRETVGYVGLLHILLIDIMTKEHFFMGTPEVKVLELLGNRNMQKDLVSLRLASELQDKVAQAQAIS